MHRSGLCAAGILTAVLTPAPGDGAPSSAQFAVPTFDVSGQVVGSTPISVYGKAPPGNRSYFDAPLTVTGSSYRVTAQSADRRPTVWAGDNALAAQARTD